MTEESTRRIGIDVGSTATKAAVIEGDELVATAVVPTGFSSIDASERISEELARQGIELEGAAIVATGYGRVAVPFADKTVTEITCHGRGADFLFRDNGVVIDVGGQDTKVIQLADGKVKKFLMNDKCSAGTGKFLEVMANRMGVSQDQLSQLAASGEQTAISSMCTVFAESEVISLIGKGEPKENIANGVIESVVAKVCSLAGQIPGDKIFLTGGLCENDYIVNCISDHLGKSVTTRPEARFAGAIGAALSA